MMYSIDDIMDMLGWKASKEEQQKGIELAKNIRSIDAFVMPLTQGINGNVWDNCAKVLAAKSDDVLDPYLSRLLIWLADIMKPGALTIYKRLRDFSKVDGNLSIAFEIRAQEAIIDDNTLWLGTLAGLIDGNEQIKAKLEKELPEDILSILHEHNEELIWLNEE